MWTLMKDFKDYIIRNNVEHLGNVKIGLLTNKEILTPESKYIFDVIKEDNVYKATVNIDSSMNFERIVILFQENNQGDYKTLGFTDTFIEFEEGATKKIEFTFSLDEIAVKDALFEEQLDELKSKIEEATNKYNSEVLPLYKDLDHADNGGDGIKFMDNLIPYYVQLDKLMDDFRNYFVKNKFSKKLLEISPENRKDIEQKLKDLDTLLTRGKKGYNVVGYAIYSAYFQQKLIYPDMDSFDRHRHRGPDGINRSEYIFGILCESGEKLTEDKFKSITGIPYIFNESEDRHRNYGSTVYTLSYMLKLIKERKTREYTIYNYNPYINLLQFSINILSKYSDTITEFNYELINPIATLKDIFNIDDEVMLYKILSYTMFGEGDINPTLLINIENYINMLDKPFYEKEDSLLNKSLYRGLLFIQSDDVQLQKIDLTDIRISNPYVVLLLSLIEYLRSDEIKLNKNINIFTKHWIDNAENHIDELIARFEAYKQDSQQLQDRNVILDKIKAIADGTESNKVIIYKDYVKKAINKIFLNKDTDLLELGSTAETPYRFTYGVTAKHVGLENDPNYETVYKPIEEKMKKFDTDIHKYFFVTPDWDEIANETGKERSLLNDIVFKIDEIKDTKNSSSYSYTSISLCVDVLDNFDSYNFCRMWVGGVNSVGIAIDAYEDTNILNYIDPLLGSYKYEAGLTKPNNNRVIIERR